MVPIDPKINRILRKLSAKKFRMEENHSDRHFYGNSDQHSEQNELPRMQESTLGDYWRPIVNENYSGIRRQPIVANNFELKASLISMVQQKQFGGYDSEDPNGHISNFLE